ncbi:helix-turn-helix domain-containing protein [Bifidobacterium pseudocatenulatum]
MAYLQCSRQHVYDLLAAGRIKTYKVGRRRYVDADSLAHLFW